MSDAEQTLEEALEQPQIMLVGASGAGKTCTAMTLSELTPDDYPNHEKQAVLDDVLYIQVERGALQSLYFTNLALPRQNVFDLSRTVLQGFSSDGGNINALIDGLTQTFDTIDERLAKEPGLKVVVDSVSAIDMLVAAYYGEKLKATKFADFKAINFFHTRLYQSLLALESPYVAICHAKVSAPVSDEVHKKAKIEAERGAGQSIVADLAITTNAREFYFRLFDEVWPVERNQTYSRGQVTETYQLRPRGNDLLPQKARLGRFLDSAEPPNLNLARKKIAKAIAGRSVLV